MDLESAVVCAFALLCGIVYLRSALAARSADGAAACEPPAGVRTQQRLQRADHARTRTAAFPRYAVACVAFATAGCLLAHLIPAAVAYAVLCLAMVTRAVADQISEERAPRRRAAVLGRSRGVDYVLLTWIALTAASAFFLFPYVVSGSDRLSAIVVALCVAAMAFVAWRIASAPPLLFGDDLEAEQNVDRATRATRTGLTCVLAVGTVFVFASFVEGPPSVNRVRIGIILGAVVVWAGIWLWQSLYSRRLSRAPLAL